MHSTSSGHAERDAHLTRTELNGFLHADEPDDGDAVDAGSGSNNYTNAASAFDDAPSGSDGAPSEGSSAEDEHVDDFGGSHARGAP